jgi:hypothetical protein
MLQLSPIIAQASLFSSAERHLRAIDAPSIDHPPRHLSASTRAAHVIRISPIHPGAAEGRLYFDSFQARREQI